MWVVLAWLVESEIRSLNPISSILLSISFSAIGVKSKGFSTALLKLALHLGYLVSFK